MMIGWNRFNIYLGVCLAATFLLGCKTSEERKREKQLSRIQIYAETPPDPMGRTREVQVYREHPVTFTVADPILQEASVKKAQIVDALGGFALRLDFDKEGTWLLEQYTSGNQGKHLVIFSQWEDAPNAKQSTGRWLAAPRIQKHIADGVLIFTPDATREELEKIVLGLNHVAKERGTGDEEGLKW